MKNCPDLSAVLAGLYDKPLLGPKPNQLLVFKRPQLAVRLEPLMQAATSAAGKHMNTSLVNQAIAALYLHPQLHDHVVGWAPVRSGQLNAEVHLSFKDTSAQHRQQIASAGAIQVTMHGAAAPISLPVSTVAAKQLPEVTVVRLHNVPGGINVHGLMACLLEHFRFGPEYTVVSEYGARSRVTLLLSLQLGVAQMSALQSSELQSKMPSCANFQLLSLALGNKCQCQSSPASLLRLTFISKGPSSVS
ncbi:hypothetical protein ABBQ38_013481 [Trebouxia sp. C0009 RCD-2024]